MNHFILVVTIKSFTIAVLLMFAELIWIHSISVIIPTSDQSGPYNPSKYLLTHITDYQQHRRNPGFYKAHSTTDVRFSLSPGSNLLQTETVRFSSGGKDRVLTQYTQCLVRTPHSHTFNSFIYLSWFCLTPPTHPPPTPSKNLPC